jgi:hypothetical protein
LKTIFPFEAESVTQGAVHSIRHATAFRSTVRRWGERFGRRADSLRGFNPKNMLVDSCV